MRQALAMLAVTMCGGCGRLADVQSMMAGGESRAAADMVTRIALEAGRDD